MLFRSLAKLRAWKSSVVGKLTKGLAGMAKQRKVTVVTGNGEFASPHTLRVETADGVKTIAFEHCIIAAGSSVSRIPGFPYEDKRIIDSTGALELAEIPKRLLIVGGGIIGLEMATVYDALGAKITVVELMDGLIPGADRDLVRVLERRISLFVNLRLDGLDPKGLKSFLDDIDSYDIDVRGGQRR